MAMVLYAGTPADYGADGVTVTARDAADSGTVTYENLVQFTPVTLSIYQERSTSSSLLDSSTLTDESGTPVDEVTGAALEVIAFYADDTVTGGKTLFGTPDAGVTWYTFHPDNAPLVNRVVALEAGTSPTSLNDLTDASTAGAADGYVLTWNSGTGVATFQEQATPDNPDWVLITDGSSSDGYADGTIIFRPPA